jgi:hypothetical protein
MLLEATRIAWLNMAEAVIGTMFLFAALVFDHLRVRQDAAILQATGMLLFSLLVVSSAKRQRLEKLLGS